MPEQLESEQEETTETNSCTTGPADPPPSSVENTYASKFRPFPKGKSGNPKGRPKGSYNKTTMAALALLDGQAEALTQKLVQMALEGDMAALRLCIERIVPIRKDRTVQLELPKVKNAADVAAGMSAVLDAVAEGVVTPSEAQVLDTVLEAQRRAIETADLETRIAALEQQARDQVRE